MVRFLQLSVLLGLALAIANGSDAKEPKSGGSSHPPKMSSSGNNYKYTHGHQFSHGICYHGSQHCHWTSWTWNSRYGCYDYWCPSASCYYYWYAPACCYYPVSCITEFPPTPVTYTNGGPTTPPLPTTAPQIQVTTPIQVTNVNQNTLANNTSPGLVGPAVPTLVGPAMPTPPPGPGFLPKAP